MVEAYRIGDMVLAEVDRIPDVSELDARATPPSYVGATIYCEHVLDGEDCALAADHASPFSRVAPGNDRWHVTLTGKAWPAADDSQTDDGVAAPGEATPALATAARPSGPVVTPTRQPRTFELYRHRDISGTSGTGVVAWGTQFPDEAAALRWNGPHPSTAAWASVEDILAVHGHGGATVVRWLDGGE